jgi:tetrahydromethanopterin S-methyltransferase subunit H
LGLGNRLHNPNILLIYGTSFEFLAKYIKFNGEVIGQRKEIVSKVI